MKRFIYLSIVFFFTPLERPAIYGGDDINSVRPSVSYGVNKVLIPYRKGGVKAPSFLTGFTTGFLWEDVTGKYGDPITVKEKTSIGAITKEPEKYLNKTVRVEGELFDVCQDMGCWFSIKDSTGAIYVDLSMGIKFTIPKKTNEYRAIVQGLVTNEGGKTAIKIKATGTEILDRK